MASRAQKARVRRPLGSRCSWRSDVRRGNESGSSRWRSHLRRWRSSVQWWRRSHLRWRWPRVQWWRRSHLRWRWPRVQWWRRSHLQVVVAARTVVEALAPTVAVPRVQWWRRSHLRWRWPRVHWRRWALLRRRALLPWWRALLRTLWLPLHPPAWFHQLRYRIRRPLLLPASLRLLCRALSRRDGVGHSIDVTNDPPAGCYYYDRFCDRQFSNLDDYTEHVESQDHPKTIEIIRKRLG